MPRIERKTCGRSGQTSFTFRSRQGVSPVLRPWPWNSAQQSPRSYRAPELLFGAQDYDQRAMDLWSLGCTLAEFFTPVRMQRTEDDDEDEPFEENAASTNFGNGSHAVPAGHEPSLRSRWRRGNLFDASRGEIGLTWSIFQTRGTPTENTWPV
jgi:serine/threonine protein kinase